jgi:hypothetical protein
VPHSSFTHPWPVAQLAAVVHEQAPPLQVPLEPHWVSVVHAPQTPLVQTCPCWQSPLAPQATVHVPAAHAWPVAQSLLTEHEQ